jgi:hypothetical protein
MVGDWGGDVGMWWRLEVSRLRRLGGWRWRWRCRSLMAHRRGDRMPISCTTRSDPALYVRRLDRLTEPRTQTASYKHARRQERRGGPLRLRPTDRCRHMGIHPLLAVTSSKHTSRYSPHRRRRAVSSASTLPQSPRVCIRDLWKTTCTYDGVNGVSISFLLLQVVHQFLSYDVSFR